MSLRVLRAIVLLAGLAACSTSERIVSADTPAAATRSYALSGISFAAADGLRVSEEAGYYPAADVVWRGDPLGPRMPQIGDMFQEAADRAATRLNGQVPVIADIRLLRFHGVTDRTRYSVGGVYDIIFTLSVRDARTGAVIEAPRRIQADLPAPGGAEAVRLENSGQTQKVRVTDFLTRVLLRELSPR